MGLSYLHLNQSLSTLSGGELQRLKLVKTNSAERGFGKVYKICEKTCRLKCLRVFLPLAIVNMYKMETIFQEGRPENIV